MRALNSILNFWKRLRNGEISAKNNVLRFFRGKIDWKMSKTNLENQFSKRKNKKQINTGAQRKKKKLNKYCPDANKKSFQ